MKYKKQYAKADRAQVQPNKENKYELLADNEKKSKKRIIINQHCKKIIKRK